MENSQNLNNLNEALSSLRKFQRLIVDEYGVEIPDIIYRTEGFNESISNFTDINQIRNFWNILLSGFRSNIVGLWEFSLISILLLAAKKNTDFVEYNFIDSLEKIISGDIVSNSFSAAYQGVAFEVYNPESLAETSFSDALSAVANTAPALRIPNPLITALELNKYWPWLTLDIRDTLHGENNLKTVIYLLKLASQSVVKITDLLNRHMKEARVFRGPSTVEENFWNGFLKILFQHLGTYYMINDFVKRFIRDNFAEADQQRVEELCRMIASIAIVPAGRRKESEANYVDAMLAASYGQQIPTEFLDPIDIEAMRLRRDALTHLRNYNFDGSQALLDAILNIRKSEKGRRILVDAWVYQVLEGGKSEGTEGDIAERKRTLSSYYISQEGKTKRRRTKKTDDVTQAPDIQLIEENSLVLSTVEDDDSIISEISFTDNDMEDPLINEQPTPLSRQSFSKKRNSKSGDIPSGGSSHGLVPRFRPDDVSPGEPIEIPKPASGIELNAMIAQAYQNADLLEVLDSDNPNSLIRKALQILWEDVKLHGLLAMSQSRAIAANFALEIDQGGIINSGERRYLVNNTITSIEDLSQRALSIAESDPENEMFLKACIILLTQACSTIVEEIASAIRSDIEANNYSPTLHDAINAAKNISHKLEEYGVLVDLRYNRIGDLPVNSFQTLSFFSGTAIKRDLDRFERDDINILYTRVKDLINNIYLYFETELSKKLNSSRTAQIFLDAWVNSTVLQILKNLGVEIYDRKGNVSSIKSYLNAFRLAARRELAEGSDVAWAKYSEQLFWFNHSHRKKIGLQDLQNYLDIINNNATATVVDPIARETIISHNGNLKRIMHTLRTFSHHIVSGKQQNAQIERIQELSRGHIGRYDWVAVDTLTTTPSINISNGETGERFPEDLAVEIFNGLIELVDGLFEINPPMREFFSVEFIAILLLEDIFCVALPDEESIDEPLVNSVLPNVMEEALLERSNHQFEIALEDIQIIASDNIRYLVVNRVLDLYSLEDVSRAKVAQLEGDLGKIFERYIENIRHSGKNVVQAIREGSSDNGLLLNEIVETATRIRESNKNGYTISHTYIKKAREVIVHRELMLLENEEGNGYKTIPTERVDNNLIVKLYVQIGLYLVQAYHQYKKTTTDSLGIEDLIPEISLGPWIQATMKEVLDLLGIPYISGDYSFTSFIEFINKELDIAERQGIGWLNARDYSHIEYRFQNPGIRAAELYLESVSNFAEDAASNMGDQISRADVISQNVRLSAVIRDMRILANTIISGVDEMDSYYMMIDEIASLHNLCERHMGKYLWININQKNGQIAVKKKDNSVGKLLKDSNGAKIWELVLVVADKFIENWIGPNKNIKPQVVATLLLEEIFINGSESLES